MEDALISRLIADPAVNLLAGERISWFARRRSDAEDGAWVVLTKVSPGREYTHDGPAGIDAPRVQADCWSPDPDAARALATAVRDVFEAGPDEIEGVRFWPAQIDGGFNDIEDQDGAAPLFRISQDFIFYHEEV